MTKPLNILYQDVPETVVADLVAQGHIVMPLGVVGADLILGPTCCRFVPGMEAFLPAIIKGIRKVKYLAEEKR